ncbi:MAG: SBBP repeat-containing protein [candidate division WOR-3 bacterium]
MISFVSAMGGNVVNSYDPSIIKEWLNSYPYLYKGFTPNKGQLATIDGKIAENVVFYSRNGNMGIFITENGMSYVIYDIEKKEVSKDNKEPSLPINKEPENSILHYSRIDYELIGGKIKKENIIYQDELPGYENFYLAHCPDGILFVKSYRKVIIKDIYPGIDWIFRYDGNGNFHHEFEVKNPQLISQIKLKVKYADIELADNGKSIILSTPIGKIKDGNLIGYQGNNIVEVSYRLKENDLLTFEAIDYDKNKSLLIDPYALVWGTYYGGDYDDIGWSIAVDAQGNIFLTGESWSTNFPVQNPYQGVCNGCPNNPDVFILKFNNSGVRQWATYYGGTDYDYGYSLTTDANSNVFITGRTFSANFPTYNPGGGAYYDNSCGGCTTYSDAFIVKFSNSGTLLWTTYYGGSNYDYGSSITTDANGNVFLTGYTYSTDFPTYNPGGGAYFQSNYAGYMDVFILKFSNSGILQWATYYGGNDFDEARSITTDDNGNVFLTGKTKSTNFPTQNAGGYFDGTCGTDGNCNGGYYDAFILKFDNSGQRLWATYYGGSRDETGYSIAVDDSGKLFVTGRTLSNDFPTQDAGNGAYYDNSCGTDGNCNFDGIMYYSDAFILRFSNSGVLQWATYYGGSNQDDAYSLIRDAQNDIFIIGRTLSNDFPTLNLGSGAYYQSSSAGYWEAFILKFGNSGVRQWATYYGGNVDDEGFSITADANNNVYATGMTTSYSFPTRNPGSGAYYQQNDGGGFDVFISKFGSSPGDIVETSNKSTFFKVQRNTLIFYILNKPSYIEITIYNANGSLNKVIKYGYVQIGKYEIGLNSLPKGVYIVNVKIDNNSNWIKFIKN